MLKALWVWLACVVCLAASAAAAETRLFTDEAPLQITLTAPFPALVRAAQISTNPFPATLTVTDGAGPAQTLPIQLSARGLTRRTGGYCQFPPLALKFDKATRHETIFRGQNKLKLVTYCRNQPDYEQRIVLEYLAYKLYNLITPMSFRVRAAIVTYRKDDKDAGVTRFGFVIEDLNDVAARNGRDKLTAATHQVQADRLDAHAAAQAGLFEYLVGNLDWDFLAGPAGVDCCHNSRFIAAKGAKADTATAAIPVPYDWDYSGFVDSPYADVPEGINAVSVRDRVYRGYCVSSGEIPAVVGEYRAQHAAMTAIINGETHLTEGFRSKAVKYIDSFFTVLDDPSRVQKSIVARCR